MADASASPGTIVVWSDIGCPWAHVAVARLHRIRAEVNLIGQVVLDHRVFALEMINDRPTPKLILEAELPVAGGLEPGAVWEMWQAPVWSYPVTTCRPWRRCRSPRSSHSRPARLSIGRFGSPSFGKSRCISLRNVILDVAETCPEVDAGTLAKALDSGAGRQTTMDQAAVSCAGGIQGSPQLVLPEGSQIHNPGMELHWEGEKGRGYPVIDSDDPSVYAELLRRAAGEPAA